MNPLKGKAVLEIDPAITFSIIDRICGGTGNLIKGRGDLTDIEKNIMEGIFVRMLENLREAWTNVMDLRPFLSRIDIDPQFSPIVPLTEMILLVTLETKVSEVEGMINVCIPFSTVEPIMEKICTYPQAVKIDLDSSEKIDTENVPVKLTAELLERNYAIKEIGEWEVGTELLPLIPLAPGRCYLNFGDRSVWQCEILPDKKRYAKRVKIIGVSDKLFGTEENIMEESKVNPILDDALSNVRVKISAEVGATVKTIKEVRGMGEGTIVELDKLAGEPADIKANGVIIARGEIVVIDENFGVRITELTAPVAVSEQGADEPSQAEAG
jgi:flagellar motor switch protein FliN